MQKILVVTVNWLGDAIMTTPAFKALKEKFPASYVAVMGVERVKDMFTDNPYIDEVIIFDEKKNHKTFLRKLQFIKELRGKGFDTVFLIHRSFTRAFICFLAGIKNRIGYRRLKNIFIVNCMIDKPGKNIHKQDYYLYLFEKAGISINDRFSKVYVPQNIKEKYLPMIEEARKKYTYLVGVNPAANWVLKRWPEKNFSMLCDKLIKELRSAIFFVGAERDSNIVKNVISNMKEQPYNFCAKTNIKELAALIENMDLFISNDSGPAHLSASLGVNTIALFGPTSPELTSPRGRAVKILKKSINCEIPCYNHACQDNLCMKNITVDCVFLETKSMLEKCLNK